MKTFLIVLRTFRYKHFYNLEGFPAVVYSFNSLHISFKRFTRRIKLDVLCKLLIFSFAVLQLSGCGKDDRYNTLHPDQGAVVVTTDWSDCSSDAVLPDRYVLRIGDMEQEVSGEMNVFNALFYPGRQDLQVFHWAEGITINENIATVNTLTDGTLDPMPGYLFSGREDLEIVKDDTLRVIVPMRQHIRSLTLTLKLTPGDEVRIAGTAAILTGIASAVDLSSGAVIATEGKDIVPSFVLGKDKDMPQIRAAGKPVLSAILHLLGAVTGERQLLTLTLTLKDGNVQIITTDLTELLKNFAAGDGEPLELDATLELSRATEVGGTITGWNLVDNGKIDVN